MNFFAGTEIRTNGIHMIESVIMGSVKGHPYMKECLDYYKNKHFIKENGEMDMTVIFLK